MCDLVSDGEFDALVPQSCKPLPPKEALELFLKENKLVCFHSSPEISEIKNQISQTNLTCALIDVNKEAEWGNLI